MSDAIKELHDYLAKSPSVVYPEDVLAYLPAIEAENAKLRNLATHALRHIIEFECEGKSCKRCTKKSSTNCPRIMPWMFDVLGIEVDE